MLTFSNSLSVYRGTGNPNAGGFYPDFIGYVSLPTLASCGTAYPITASGTWTFSAGDRIAAGTSVISSPAIDSVTISLQGPPGAGPTQVLSTLTA